MKSLKIVSCIILYTVFAINSTFAQQVGSLDSKTKRTFDFLYYEALQSRVVDDYASAFDYLKFCHTLDSTNAAVLYELGNYYNTIGDKKRAYKMYKGAAENDSNNYYYGSSYATLALELNQFDEAIQQYLALVDLYPERSNLYIYLAESYRQTENYTKAIESLDKLEQFVGMNEKISIQKFQLFQQLKQEQKAFAEIQKYIDKYPSEIKYYVLLGDLYLHADKDDDAIRTYSRAKAIDPDDPYLISSIASYYEKVGKKEEAEDELKIALISTQMDIETKLGILAQYVSTLQHRHNDTKDANALFDTLMVQHPQEPNLNLMYGNLLNIQENKEAARAQYQIFAEANPSNPLGWEQMLFTAYPDSLDISIEICEAAIKHIPNQPQFYFFLGLSQYLKKDYEPALKALKEGVQYVEKENSRLLSDFYGQIGDLYYHTEQVDSAFVAYDEALKANPNNLGILNNYSYFLTLEKKDLDKAERMSGITIKAEPLNPTYLDTYGWVLFMQKAYSMARIYIENAVEYSRNKEEEISSEVFEHYGDVLYKTGEEEKALEYWIKAKEVGDTKSKTLDKKIETKEYIEP